jgi:putative transposase
MARKRYKPEEIVAKLRQVDVLVSQGQNMVDAIRQIGVSEVTYYRWRQEFGGLKSEQVKRLKDLELENTRLRKAVSDLTLDKLILQEAAASTNGDVGRAPQILVVTVRQSLSSRSPVRPDSFSRPTIEEMQRTCPIPT